MLYGLHAILRLHFAQEEEAYAWLASERGAGRRPVAVRRSPAGPRSVEVACRRTRQEHVERRSASLALLDPRAPAVQLREARHEREAHADAGRSVRHGALSEGLEDRVAVLGRDARAVVLDDHDRPPVRGSTRTQIRASSGVCFAVFVSRLSTIRSTIARSAWIVSSGVSRSRRRCVASSELTTDSRTSAPTSSGRRTGRSTPPARRSRSSMSATRRSGPLGVRRDPASEVAGIVPVEVDLVPLERDGEPEDRGERRAQVVRDRLEEGVLQLVGLAQLVGGLPLRRQVGLERLRALLFGDVHEDALPVHRLAGVVRDQSRLVVHPHHASVARDEPVHGVGQIGIGVRGPFPVLRMDDRRSTGSGRRTSPGASSRGSSWSAG